ncbi:DUF742 domain-containing protein [Couchioplanes caeruleus]|uniref:DUF742 domain-containing protein n=1 Tax=Couchioplanes caeruleus TaxID=56438 RepID=UPI0020C0C201|nr:DUF742 domain-containing protein [Couchioplanes caeruleus]UQU65167.1 DUF742 domain-containing protein [Couchioplanes caeruleus]
MSFPADPDDPDHPATTGVRPFLRNTGPGVRYEPAPAPAPGPAPGEPPGEHTTSLRPFVITSGRVAAVDPAIGLETQVSAHPGALSARLSPEQRAIVHLCGEPLSVAEISARLRLHFGVTRILVGDLRAAGHLDVHVLENDFPDPETIMRVIRGLRSIS